MDKSTNHFILSIALLSLAYLCAVFRCLLLYEAVRQKEKHPTCFLSALLLPDNIISWYIDQIHCLAIAQASLFQLVGQVGTLPLQRYSSVSISTASFMVMPTRMLCDTLSTPYDKLKPNEFAGLIAALEKSEILKITKNLHGKYGHYQKHGKANEKKY